METDLQIKPKITTLDEAAKFTNDFTRNPPETPLDVVRVAASAFDADGVVSQGLGFAFPLAGSVLPALASVFSLFGGSSPSIGQITLTAIAQVSQQLQKGFQDVKETLSKVAEIQATRTIDTVLSGATELAREQSAVDVYKTFTASAILDQVESQKAAIFAEYTETLNAQRDAWVADVSEALKLAQEKTNAQYKIVQEQLASIAGGLFGELSDKLKKAADDAQELLEIQRQIDEINKLINDGALPVIAVNLIREFYGLT